MKEEDNQFSGWTDPGEIVCFSSIEIPKLKPTDVCFSFQNNDSLRILDIQYNGDIFYKGNQIGTDKEILIALREALGLPMKDSEL